MKRIIYIITVFSLFLMLACPLSISAEEIDTAQIGDTSDPVEETVSDAVEAEETTTVPADKITDEEDTNTNIFTRLYEAFCDNKSEVFTLGGSSILLILSIILKKELGSSSKTIVNGIADVLKNSDISTERQEAIVGGLNEMIDGYEEIKGQTEYVKKKIEEFKEAVERVESSNSAVDAKLAEMFTTLTDLIVKEMRQNTELMEVLSTVYTNNEAIPQGIKDFVSLMRTENVKLVQEASEITTAAKDISKGGEEV